MSKLIDMKLAYLETDIRQNLSTVIQNYAAFVYDVNDADKRAFTNFEFKLLLERLEQIRKNGTTKIAKTDAAEPKLGHRTAIPYPEGGIEQGIEVGIYEDQTLGGLLEEHIEEDVRNFYIYKARSSTFVSTLQLVDDLQSATLEDFEKLNCSKEITKMMKPLSKVGSNLVFYIENYLKDDDAIFINTKVRSNVEDHIHTPVITPLYEEFNSETETFRIANGVQPFASTLPVGDKLESMQAGNGVEIELSSSQSYRAITDDIIADIREKFEIEKATIEKAFAGVEWLKKYLRNRHNESVTGDKISTLASSLTEPTEPSGTPETNPQAWANYNSVMAAYRQGLTDLSDLCNSFEAYVQAVPEEEINENREYLMAVKASYEGSSPTSDADSFPENRQTRISADFSKAQSGQYGTLSLKNVFPSTAPSDYADVTIAKTAAEYNYCTKFKNVADVNTFLSYALRHISAHPFKDIIDILEPASTGKQYEKFIDGLEAKVSAIKTAAAAITSVEATIQAEVAALTMDNTGEAYNQRYIDSFRESFDALIEQVSEMIESLPVTPITLNDIYVYCVKTFSNYDVALFEDRGVVNIIYNETN